ncbi:Uncharacterised protein [Klebsiella michiganensis]|nr:Uncharacterised protein [Klebsiella michiganensis]
MLERSHYTHAGNLLARQPFQMLVTQHNGAAGWLIETGQTVKNGGFARAVRADKRNDFPLAQLQRHVVDRQQAAKTHHQTVYG